MLQLFSFLVARGHQKSHNIKDKLIIDQLTLNKSFKIAKNIVRFEKKRNIVV